MVIHPTPVELPTTAQFLQLKRTARGLSQHALSVQAGLSGSYVYKLEAGSLVCSLKSFSKLADVLELTPTEVFTIVRCEALR